MIDREKFTIVIVLFVLSVCIIVFCPSFPSLLPTIIFNHLFCSDMILSYLLLCIFYSYFLVVTMGIT